MSKRAMVAALLIALACAGVSGRARAEEARPTLVLGAENDAAPWSLADGSGFVNELVRTIFASQGWSVRLEVLPYARCKALVLRGQLAGCFTASMDAELGQRLLFPRQPVIAPRHQLYVGAQSPLQACKPDEWAHPLRVAETHGYEYADEATALRTRGRIRAQVVMSESNGLRMLAAGRVDAVLLTTDEVKRIDYLVQLAGTRQAPRLLCDFGAVPGYLAFSPQHPQGRAALAAFEQGYEQLRKEGGLARLKQAWADRVMRSAQGSGPH